MAYTANWITKLITIPLSDLVWASGNTYELALSDFLTEVRRLEWASHEGLWAAQILEHTNPKTISGVVYAAFDEVINGYTFQFTGSPDAVILKGSNNNILDVYVFNGVSVAPNNSTGLQDLSTLLIGAYASEVCFSELKGIPGTSVPIGTRAKPSNSWTDLKEIADSKGISRIRILGSTIMGADTVLGEGHEITSDNALTNLLTVNPEADVTNCTFTNLTLTGTLDGNNVVRDSAIYDLYAIQGILHQITVIGNISIQAGGLLTMLDCHSGVAGGGAGQTANISMGGTGSLRNSNYVGGVNITNYAGGGDISMDVEGRVIVDATCTDGDIYIRGSNCQVIDNSTGTCVVHDQTNLKAINDMPFNIWADGNEYDEESKGSIIDHLIHLRYSLFINTELVEPGNGSQHSPFNNMTTAIDYAELHGIYDLIISSNVDIDRQIKNFTITGIGTPTVDCGGFNLEGSEFFHVRMTNTYLGTIKADSCNLTGLFTLNGGFKGCVLSNSFDVPAGAITSIKDCATLETALVPTEFVLGVGASVIMTSYDGGVQFSGISAANSVVKCIRHAGTIILNATCTAGVFRGGGIGSIVNNSTMDSVTDKMIEPEKLKDIPNDVLDAIL